MYTCKCWVQLQNTISVQNNYLITLLKIWGEKQRILDMMDILTILRLNIVMLCLINLTLSSQESSYEYGGNNMPKKD